MFNFKGIDKKESLECFHDRVVNPDTEYLKQCGRIIDGISTLLKSRKFGFNVSRTIKGGSIGKGTAVRNLSDVDLIFPIYDIQSVDKLRDKMDDIFAEVRKTLEWSEEYKCKYQKHGTWAITFKVLISGNWQEVEIIPIANLAGDPSNLSDAEMKSIHAKMEATGGDTRSYYNRCLRPIQTEFIGQKDPKIKMAIRLIKYWIKTKGHDLIKSITAELLVIRAWEDLEKPQPSIGLKFICKPVFEMLSNIGELEIYWTKYYQPTDYGLPSVPYILDPVDPYNNVIQYITDNYTLNPLTEKEKNPLTQKEKKQADVMEQVRRLEKDARLASKTIDN